MTNRNAHKGTANAGRGPHRDRMPYDAERIPVWCSLPEAEHRTVTGCIAIAFSWPPQNGPGHCHGCEHFNEFAAEKHEQRETTGADPRAA